MGYCGYPGGQSMHENGLRLSKNSTVFITPRLEKTNKAVGLGACFLGVNLGSLSTTNSILHFKLHL